MIVIVHGIPGPSATSASGCHRLVCDLDGMYYLLVISVNSMLKCLKTRELYLSYHWAVVLFIKFKPNGYFPLLLIGPFHFHFKGSGFVFLQIKK